jgi:hypothetical protein
MDGEEELSKKQLILKRRLDRQNAMREAAERRVEAGKARGVEKAPGAKKAIKEARRAPLPDVGTLPKDPLEVFYQTSWGPHLSNLLRDDPKFEQRVKAKLMELQYEGIQDYPKWKKHYDDQKANGIPEEKARKTFLLSWDKYNNPKWLVLSSLKLVHYRELHEVCELILKYFPDEEWWCQMMLTDTTYRNIFSLQGVPHFEQGKLIDPPEDYFFRRLTNNRIDLKDFARYTLYKGRPAPTAQRSDWDSYHEKEAMINALIKVDAPPAAGAAAAAAAAGANEERKYGGK